MFRDVAAQISSPMAIFAESVGLSAGTVAGQESAAFLAARVPGGIVTFFVADQGKDDQFASFMKENLKK